MIHYSIGSRDPAAHYFDVTLHIPKPDPAGQLLRLPAWIPGSYMIRDFARNIIDINARKGDQSLQITQLDKSTWQVEACADAIQVDYRVYAWDLSVRSAHLDGTHGFFNGTSVFFEVVGQSDKACEVMINRPQHTAGENWRLATTLPRASADPDDFGFGLFVADDYQQLIDYPVEMGEFTQLDFNAGGIRHDVILTGKFNCDQQRLKADLEKICQQHIDFFGAPPPMSRYMFLVMVVGEGYGGLEHLDSTSLLCSRKNLPQPGQSDKSEEYRTFLGLCSHEYFHSWNVKRIKPAVFDAPDLSTEVYTPLLWAFEGITSYYDDLAMVRSGCITASQYLELVGQIITRVMRTPGRLRQSAAESSFNAWSKFYKQDENAGNSIVSYYAKGSLIALCLDLKIRQLTQGQKSLDDVMRHLWRDYLDDASGLDEFRIQQVVNELVGIDLSALMQDWIYGTADLPLADLLQTVAVTLNLRASAGPSDKGGKEAPKLPTAFFGANVVEQNGELTLLSVVEGASAQQAGLSAGDILIAVNGLRASTVSIGDWLALARPGTEHRVMAFRRDELMTFDVTLQAPPLDTAVLSITDESAQAFKQWISNA